MVALAQMHNPSTALRRSSGQGSGHRARRPAFSTPTVAGGRKARGRAGLSCSERRRHAHGGPPSRLGLDWRRHFPLRRRESAPCFAWDRRGHLAFLRALVYHFNGLEGELEAQGWCLGGYGQCGVRGPCIRRGWISAVGLCSFAHPVQHGAALGLAPAVR